MPWRISLFIFVYTLASYGAAAVLSFDYSNIGVFTCVNPTLSMNEHFITITDIKETFADSRDWSDMLKHTGSTNSSK